MTLLQLLQTSEREQEQEKREKRETKMTGLAVHRWWRRGQDSKTEEDGRAGQNRLN